MSLTGRVSSSEPGRKARMPLTRHGQAALDLAVDGAGHEFAGLERVLERQPRGQALGLVARQDGVAVAVFDRVDGHRHEIADLDFELALVVLEFFNGHVGFGLEACVHHHEVVVDTHHFGGDDLAAAHLGALQRFFEQGGKGFAALAGGSLGLRHEDFRVQLALRLG
jgi:hypothetical protein